MPYGHLHFHPEHGLFTGRGSAVYNRLSPLLVGWLYKRVATDVVAAKPAGPVVDVGCGPGHADVRIAQSAPAIEVIGLDPSPDMIRHARANATSAGAPSHLRFEVGGSAALPFADSSVALIISSLSVHHWDDVAGGLAECLRVLQPGASSGSTSWTS